MTSDGVSVRVEQGTDAALVSACLPQARLLTPSAFESRTADVYRAIEQQLAASPTPRPVRFWNFLPGIHTPCGDGTDRYMSFNAGRFAAFSTWLGGHREFDRTVPTASAVGVEGDDLVVLALASAAPGVPIANPRQIAPHRYSRRFGPRPPCFARATVLPGHLDRPTRILVGGTASIRGEESIHLESLQRQIDETLHNLAHLIRAAAERDAPTDADLSPRQIHDLLSGFVDLRVYHPRAGDRDAIVARVAPAFPASCRIEFVRADLCRAELLVEIEGLAQA